MTPHYRAGYTVLVVDDDPAVLATYCRLLRRAGYTTVTESDPFRVLTDHAADPATSPLHAVYGAGPYLAPKIRAFVDFLAGRFASGYAWRGR